MQQHYKKKHSIISKGQQHLAAHDQKPKQVVCQHHFVNQLQHQWTAKPPSTQSHLQNTKEYKELELTKRNTQHGAPVELRWLRGLIVHTTPEVSWKPISWSSVDPATKANDEADWVAGFSSFCCFIFFSLPSASLFRCIHPVVSRFQRMYLRGGEVEASTEYLR
ncbi:hypothetical protein LXL04_014174 [Taraxacum kok-saghyz]